MGVNEVNMSLYMRENATQNDIKISSDSLSHDEIVGVRERVLHPYLSNIFTFKIIAEIMLFSSSILFENVVGGDGIWISDEHKARPGVVLSKDDIALKTRHGVITNQELINSHDRQVG
jgi:hypothetical protein